MATSRGAAPYIICFLLAVIMTLVPAAIFIDFAAGTFPKWENWYHDRNGGVRPSFVGSNMPWEIGVEEVVFRVAVVPPGVVAKALLGGPGTFAGPYLSPLGSSFHRAAVHPPLALALENGRVALPFWFLAFVAIYETSRLALRRWRHPRAVA
jgi:hypothetical protein